MDYLIDLTILTLWITGIVIILLLIAFFALSEPDQPSEWDEIDGHDYTDQEEWR